MAATVFISYKQPDRASAERICAELEGQGVICWMAPRDIPPGTDWPGAVMQAIKGAKMLVLLLSSQSHSDKQVSREVENADHVGLQIITFRLDNVSPPDNLAYFLRNLQWLDAFDGRFEAAVQQLAKLVASKSSEDSARSANPPTPASAPELAPPVPPDSPRPRPVPPNRVSPSKGLTALVGIIALTVVVVGLWLVLGHHQASAMQLRSDALNEWKTGQKDKALEDISKAITKDPSLAENYLTRGTWEAENGDFGPALTDFDACLAKNPAKKFAKEAYARRARVKQKTGDHAGAVSDLQEAQKLGGDQAGTRQ